MEAWLKCKIIENLEDRIVVSCNFIDGEPFTITAPRWDVNIDRSRLRVTYQGKNHEKASVILPAPNTEHGHSVVVKYSDLAFGA